MGAVRYRAQGRTSPSTKGRMMSVIDKQIRFQLWQTKQLIDGLLLSGVPQQNIDEAMNYASKKTLDDFYAEVDPFNNGGTKP